MKPLVSSGLLNRLRFPLVSIKHVVSTKGVCGAVDADIVRVSLSNTQHQRTQRAMLLTEPTFQIPAHMGVPLSVHKLPVRECELIFCALRGIWWTIIASLSPHFADHMVQGIARQKSLIKRVGGLTD